MPTPAELLAFPSAFDVKEIRIKPSEKIAKCEPEQLRRLARGVLDAPPQKDFADRGSMRWWQLMHTDSMQHL